jgi:hypothetical protein
MSKFDDAIAAAKAAHFDQPEVIQLIELIVAQNERIKNLEHFQLETKTRMAVSEKLQNEHTDSIASLAKSRDDHETRVKTVEDKPVVEDGKIKDLEKRVTVVEGAVGSKAYRRAETKNETKNTADPLAPVPPATPEAPKPHFWDAPKAEAKPDIPA